MAVWSSAWLHGRAASDHVLDALLGWAERHDVVAADDDVADRLRLPVSGTPPATPVQLLAGLRLRGAHAATLVLPVPGDVRGLGGGGAVVPAALGAGEAVSFADIGVALVPATPRGGIVRWTVYSLAQPTTRDHVGIGDAEYVLSEAVRTSAATLAALDVANDRPDAHHALMAQLKAVPRPEWPDGMPGRSLRVLQRAEEVAAILSLAESDDPGGAVSARSAVQRTQALRPLAAAVRTARCGAVNEAVRVFADRAENLP